MLGYVPLSQLSISELLEADTGTSVLVTFYMSNDGYISKSSDTPASQYFDSWLVNPIRFSRGIVGTNLIAGLTETVGEIQIDNSEGQLDNLLNDFSVIGRSATVKLGKFDWSYDMFQEVFNATIDNLDMDTEMLRIVMSDSLEDIREPIQTTLYAGTGDEEGGSDLEDKPKPLAYGQVFNVPAVLVDAADLLYQVHTGQMQGVDDVYDRGVALTQADDNGGDYSTVTNLLAATTGAAGSGEDIEAGEYATCLAEGFFRLGGNPDGTITADVKGDATSSYVNTTSDIIKRILKNQYSFSDSDLDLPSFSDLNTDNGSEVGIWIGPEQTEGTAVIEQLILGVGGFAGFNRLDKFQVGVFKSASGDSVLDFDETNINNIEVVPLPSGISPPNWRRQVGYQKNYTVQDDIAGSVSSSQRAFISQAYRVTAASDSSVQNNFSLATDPPFIQALYAQESDASTEASRLLTLYKEKHQIFRIEFNFPFKLNINEVVKITYPRFGLDNGKKGRVVSLEDDAAGYSSVVEIFI